MAKRLATFRDLFSNKKLYSTVPSPDHWVMRGKFERDVNQLQPKRTNSDNCFRGSLWARLGCFRPEFRHKTSALLQGTKSQR